MGSAGNKDTACKRGIVGANTSYCDLEVAVGGGKMEKEKLPVPLRTCW